MLARLLSLTTLLAGVAQADCSTPLRAGISELGYSGYRDAGKSRGAAVDVLTEVGRRIGCPLDFQLVPRSRLFVQFDAWQFDIASSAAQSVERDRTGTFVPYAMSRYDLVTGKPKSYTRLADFIDQSGGRLNSVRGAYYPPHVVTQLERLRQAGRLDEVADFDTAFKKMAAGRAEAVLAPEMVSARLLRENRLEDVATVSVIEEAEDMPVGMYVSRQTVSPALLKRIEAAIQAMGRDGSITAIYARYVGEATARRITTSNRQGSGKRRKDLPRP